MDEIDWDEVDRLSDEYLHKCAELDKQIAEERKKPMTIEDLKRASERVDEYIKKYGLNAVYIDVDDKNNK